ncbi:MAG: T9SS type A sorting domain-containing protein [Chitinophagaceae bacterium]|nr:T9SS type A sorting domain-containing protein [Chitinophagaceae bacterium]
MKLQITLFITLFSTIVNGQSNLLQNSGFEDHSQYFPIFPSPGSYPEGNQLAQADKLDFWKNEKDVDNNPSAECEGVFFPNGLDVFYAQSPDWFYLKSGYSAHTGNGLIHMSTYELIQQQLDQNNSLIPCLNYKLSLYFRFADPDPDVSVSIKIYAAKQRITYKKNNCAFLCSEDYISHTNGLSQDIQEIASFPINTTQYPANNNDWYYLSQTIENTLDGNLYNWIAIELRVDNYGGDPNFPSKDCYGSTILIDDVSLSYECCPSYKLYQNTDRYPTNGPPQSDLPELTWVSDYIRVGSDVGAGNPPGIGPVTVFSGMNVTLKAGGTIDEFNGFYAEPGANYLKLPGEVCVGDNPITSVNISDGFTMDCTNSANNIWPLVIEGGISYHLAIINQWGNGGSTIYEGCGPITSNVINLWNGYCPVFCGGNDEEHIFQPNGAVQVVVYVLFITDCNGAHLYEGDLTVIAGPTCSGKFANVFGEDVSATYPNPSDDYFFIKISNNQEVVRFRIVDLVGHVMQEGQLDSELFKIKSSLWPSGLYIVELRNSHNQLVKYFKQVIE